MSKNPLELYFIPN